MKEKSIKDAVHGYIRLGEPYWRIVDTAVFQRLKWIEQTSFRPLFPSARHDRFIHSIGVFHLGEKAVTAFEGNASKSDRDVIEYNKPSFLLACLLHDIGHAPFSHTSEKMFNYMDKRQNLNAPLIQELVALIRDRIESDAFDIFYADYSETIRQGAVSEHEIMSSIIACRLFDEIRAAFRDDVFIDIELIVRAIIGCCYGSRRTEDDAKNREKGIKNCLIRLLNSPNIDVDKLDYIARDTMMTGYDNIVIDTSRLLDSVTMVCDKNIYYPAYKKSAISVINNVVMAKLLQAKWIVNHPTIIYDSYLLERAMLQSLKYYANKINCDGDEFINAVFSSDALLTNGVTIKGFRVSLLSDIDILYLLKQNIESPLVREYFCRDTRKKPIWKSHEEYLYYLDSNRDKAKQVSMFLAPLLTLSDFHEMGEGLVINDELLNRINNSNNIEGASYIVSILEALKEFDPDNFEYVILPANNKFRPKIDPKKVYISFGCEENEFAPLEKLDKFNINTDECEYAFYYLYSNGHIDPKSMLDYLHKKAEDCAIVRV